MRFYCNDVYIRLILGFSKLPQLLEFYKKHSDVDVLCHCLYGLVCFRVNEGHHVYISVRRGTSATACSLEFRLWKTSRTGSK